MPCRPSALCNGSRLKNQGADSFVDALILQGLLRLQLALVVLVIPHTGVRVAAADRLGSDLRADVHGVAALEGGGLHGHAARSAQLQLGRNTRLLFGAVGGTRRAGGICRGVRRLATLEGWIVVVAWGAARIGLLGQVGTANSVGDLGHARGRDARAEQAVEIQARGT